MSKVAQDIILRPIITENSMDGIADRKYTFEVAKDANKIEIAKAVEELFDVKVAKVTNINNAIDKLKENGFWVYGAELGGESIYKSNLTGKICLVIGGEDSGVKRLTKEKCDAIVSIPMLGKVNSLNASVVCGIVVYEVVRQRSLQDK